eukprot:CAMPEP_0202685974 /NCGR_PEP_ID=MMETSP1385-20130828/1762_1 /ASSEMBLY_ACC=CAM_ASM_000861 /TAXON_ID=933848 /ORGANISM="Elphidium margaritaceum" /LENGTH=560 /DNA_ID=CAMNT_0049340453 /DNA_START=60 /DNA_END=1742 /DNA_ORIENTATION=+
MKSQYMHPKHHSHSHPVRSTQHQAVHSRFLEPPKTQRLHGFPQIPQATNFANIHGNHGAHAGDDDVLLADILDIDIPELEDLDLHDIKISDDVHHLDDDKCVDYYCGLLNSARPPAILALSPGCSPSNSISAQVANFSVSLSPNTSCSPLYSSQQTTYSEGPSSTSTQTPFTFPPTTTWMLDENQSHNYHSSNSEQLKICDIVQRNMSIAAIIKNDFMTEMLTDQSGSRYLQKTMKESGDKQDVASMVSYCVDKHRTGALDLVAVSEDVYGNYIVQLWFTFGGEDTQRLLLDSFVNRHFVRLSRSMYGCRVIQRCLKCVCNTSLLCTMVKCFDEQSASDNQLHDCFICPYTNHVVQAILDLKFERVENILFIKRALEKNLACYCEHVFGCRVIQCFINNYGQLLDVSLLMRNDEHLNLCKLKYGNYVIQCIIDKNEWYSECDRIRQFRYRLIDDVFSVRNLLFLSKNKFGSNVVEKCIKCANRKQKSLLVHTIIKHQHLVPTMIKHCYANYAIKALLNEASRKNQSMLIKCVKFHCDDDKLNKYCKDLINEIQRILKSFE